MEKAWFLVSTYLSYSHGEVQFNTLHIVTLMETNIRAGWLGTSQYFYEVLRFSMKKSQNIMNMIGELIKKLRSGGLEVAWSKDILKNFAKFHFNCEHTGTQEIEARKTLKAISLFSQELHIQIQKKVRTQLLVSSAYIFTENVICFYFLIKQVAVFSYVWLRTEYIVL